MSHVAGSPGQWLFRTSNRFCERPHISYDFLCRRWYVLEWDNRFLFGISDPFQGLPACPCWWRQARWDWRYRIDFRTRCATLRSDETTQV